MDSKSLVPHIICAMTSAPNQQQSIDKIVKFVEERLGEKAKQINNIKDKIKTAIADVSAFGLVSTYKDIVRLRYNPKTRPLFGLQPVDESEDRDEEFDDDDDAQNETSTTSDHKTREKPKSSKNSGKKPSDYSIIVPVPTEIRRRKRKSRSRSRRGRSKSAKRRRR